MTRRFPPFLTLQSFLTLLMLVLCTACNQMMDREPRYDPLVASDFFRDGQAARPQIAGTVVHGYTLEGALADSGRTGDQLLESTPMPVTIELLSRGRERFDIYCSPCHGRTGDGDGMVVERGFQAPPSYHIDRLRAAPIGHFVDVMTNGYGAMASYRSRVPPEDRWAIAAYIRALQLSRHATLADVPAEARQQLESAP